MKYLTASILVLLSSMAFATNPNSVVPVDLSGWIFFGEQCFGENIVVDDGQVIRVRVGESGTPEDTKFRLRLRSTDKVSATGIVTGYKYVIHQVWSPFGIPEAPPLVTTQLQYTNGNGAGHFMIRFNVFSPGAPEMGHYVQHAAGHILYTGDSPDDFEILRESFSADCIKPN